MSALKMMHVAKRDLNMDEDDYRELLKRVTGKSSAKLMTVSEQQSCVAEFRRLGFQSKTRLEGAYAKKMQALWLSAYHLGIVRNRKDEALLTFVKNRTGIEHVNWVKDARDASRVIEALKAWMTRKAGVEWPKDHSDAIGAKRAIIAAQLRILGRDEAQAQQSTDAGLHELTAALGEEIRKVKA